ncbi:RNA-directed DNA polymerase [Microbulbifer sp. JMSA008]|uniref:RNA-directed DNA polymerase n=1 Tax=Microbulbifer sp. JMSA008 TaxID=3243373 RepID=UPI004039D57A
MKLITTMSAEEARSFFLKHESYCNFSLPPYFDFQPILEVVKDGLSGIQNGLSDIGLKKASKFDRVNYILQTNKDGHYAWRPFQLIHPALYVHLASMITTNENWTLIKQRFEEFRENEKICAASLPREASDDNSSNAAESVKGWWNEVEQSSIEKSLDFKYVFHTDVANFYPSIYTHSISWAIHKKEVAKKPENRHNYDFIGVSIDKAIQHMQNGQTNGIPQGSVLMDFIAELILGYTDSELSKRLNALGIEDYHIIRYRDDYRVFTNTKEDNDTIAQQIALTLQDLGLQLNASKTTSSEDLIIGSIKEDKLEALSLFDKSQREATIQNSLLKIVLFSRKFPNSGQILKQLAKLSRRLDKKKTLKENPRIIISIITDIMVNNPRTFASCALTLSKALKFIDDINEKIELLKKIRNKLNSILGTGVLDIWMQRISYSIQPDMEYDEPLCSITAGVPGIEIWEYNWIDNGTFKNNCLSTSIINREILAKLDSEIKEDEVVLFPYGTDSGG